MIEYRRGDIFQSGCEAVVNTVNCRGIMGKGLALLFKQRYPEMFKEYVMICQEAKLAPGLMHIWENPVENPKYVVNFPTKVDWRNPSRNVYITSGLAQLAHDIKKRNIKSIAIPPLGCGLGGLVWFDVKMFIEEFHKTLPENVKVVVYEPL